MCVGGLRQNYCATRGGTEEEAWTGGRQWRETSRRSRKEQGKATPRLAPSLPTSQQAALPPRLKAENAHARQNMDTFTSTPSNSHSPSVPQSYGVGPRHSANPISSLPPLSHRHGTQDGTRTHDGNQWPSPLTSMLEGGTARRATPYCN